MILVVRTDTDGTVFRDRFSFPAADDIEDMLANIRTAVNTASVARLEIITDSARWRAIPISIAWIEEGSPRYCDTDPYDEKYGRYRIDFTGHVYLTPEELAQYKRAGQFTLAIPELLEEIQP